MKTIIEVFPEIVELISPNNKVDYKNLSAHTSSKILLKCFLNHEYEKKISSISKVTENCPYCNNYKMLNGFNSVKDLLPEFVEKYWLEAGVNSPENFTIKSSKKLNFTCPLNHIYNNRISSIITLKNPCPYCSNRKLLKGFNDLESKRPDLVKYWSNKNVLKASEVLFNSSSEYIFNCEVGHEYSKPLNKFISQKFHPCCSGYSLMVGMNDFETTHKDFLKFWNYEKNKVRPSEVTAGYSGVIEWLCPDCDYCWRSVLSNKSTPTCPKCSNYGSSFVEKGCLNELIKVINEFFSKNFSYTFNDRDIISPKELDLYCEELNIAIEFDGDYWHGDELSYKYFGMSGGERRKLKMELCEDIGIRLFIVIENDWKNHKDKVVKVFKEFLIQIFN